MNTHTYTVLQTYLTRSPRGIPSPYMNTTKVIKDWRVGETNGYCISLIRHHLRIVATQLGPLTEINAALK